MRTLILAALGAFVYSASASAQTYSVTYSGLLDFGQANDTLGLFGGGDLSGDVFSLTFTYDLTDGVHYTSPGNIDEVYGGSFYPLSDPILSDVVVINGHSFSLTTGYYGSTEISGGFYLPSSFSAVQDSAGNEVFGNFRSPAWTNIVNIAASQGFSSSYDHANGYVSQVIYDGEHLYLDAYSVDIEAVGVPEPGSLGLLVAALGLTGIAARRRGAAASGDRLASEGEAASAPG